MSVFLQTSASLRLPIELQEVICRIEALNKADLARLALTCKAWYFVANPVLWETLHGLGPLLDLMSADVWSEPAIGPDGSLNPNYRALTPDDWVPVLKLSPLVKRLRLPHVEPNAQSRIVRNPPPRTLLPSLRSLEIWTDEFRALDLLNGFGTGADMFLKAIIPSTLLDLTLTNSFADTLTRHSGILCRATQLTSLIIRETVLDEAYDTYQYGNARLALVHVVSTCHYLTHVEVTLPFIRNPALMEALSRLPALDFLRLKFCCTRLGESWVGRQPEYAARAFPALQFCEIHGLSFVDAANLLKFDGMRPLQVVHIVSPDPDTPADLWARMARSWPELREIVFAVYKATETPQSPCTLAALAALASHCPLIRDIQIPFHAAHLPPLPEATKISVPRRHKVKVTVGLPEDISSAEDVVAALRGLFGNVTVNLCYKEVSTEFAEAAPEIKRRVDLWDQVMAMTSGRRDA
ncbi:hypothetical protein HDZ31DRAFT_76698 [Schizophyllum fasciatum]